jgi:hypothetical protein
MSHFKISNSGKQPHVAEAKAKAPGAPCKAPGPKNEAGRVLLSEARPSKSGSTFRAPRKESGGGAVEQGYTKVGKV